MSLLDTFLADTAGVAYRAATGNVDPWTKQELIDQQTKDVIAAGGDPATAATQAEKDVTETLKTFTLGGDDPIGADPSQTTGIRLPSAQSFKDALDALKIPKWVPYAAAGVGVLLVLAILAPYVGLLPKRT
jgi:hypothetical protein